MYSTLFWFLAIAGFVVQILCCVHGKKRLTRLVPMLVMGVIMVLTLVLGTTLGGLGLLAALVFVWNEAKILATMLLGYGLWALVDFAKK